MIYVLDSNTVSYFLRGEGSVQDNFQKEIVASRNFYAIPFVVVYEIKRWLLDRPTKIEKIYNQNFDGLFQKVRHEADMDVQTWGKATEVYITLKRDGKLIADSDILIAAYCIANGYTLVTRNTKDFARIKNLKIVNWY